MTKYGVELELVNNLIFDVEADSFEEAEDLAMELAKKQLKEKPEFDLEVVAVWERFDRRKA